MSGEYASLRLQTDRGVAWVTIDNPPLNLLDATLRADLDNFTREIAEDEAVRVIVFQSANPDFFVAHADVEQLLGRYTKRPPRLAVPSPIQDVGERLRTMPKVTIAKIEGRASGGGSELALNLDLRFAARGKAILSQPEVALGIIPGAGATQRLPRLMGRARALEVVFGGVDFDADQAERYGWVNRALPADELGPFVERLAHRIASFPAYAIAKAKRAIDAALPSPVPGLIEEANLFIETITAPEGIARLRAFLAAGGQTREYELELGSRLEALQPGEDDGNRQP